MKRPAVIAIDLGGVLFDVSPLRLAGVPAAALAEALFASGAHQAVQLGQRSATAWLAEAAARLSIAPAALEQAWADRFVLAPHADRLLKLLADRDAVIWSNLDELHWAVAERCLPRDLAASPRRALSFELGARKPDARFFDLGVARAGKQPLLFLDDQEANVRQAQALGLQAAVVRGPLAAAEHISKAFASAV